ncbi:conserved hypothetical protein [Perkinsus marinus ATCC 50983]|uniref:Uncharacterized protein n=1 Tax=Perkinsus marinus (strain ATCC 50983 / TXsc) TaxID=423536 RepID=C5LKZ8_PERM5|nr:conserved hypothetical protein [Perkinsus marinus ATCC 50983]EER02562.1 conserved hypothetical protein [Perkinsus marinus ATCC 50983]|eukprot:XP_002769844.1 conserved hypothetical protein [Perkinsus marinus ATCC 50983]
MSNVSASAKRRARAKNTKERLFAGANDAEGDRSKPEDRCGQLKETRNVDQLAREISALKDSIADRNMLRESLEKVQTASEDCEQKMQKLKVQLQRASDDLGCAKAARVHAEKESISLSIQVQEKTRELKRVQAELDEAQRGKEQLQHEAESTMSHAGVRDQHGSHDTSPSPAVYLCVGRNPENTLQY